MDRVNLTLIVESTSFKGLYDKGQIYRHEVAQVLDIIEVSTNSN